MGLDTTSTSSTLAERMDDTHYTHAHSAWAVAA
jgi:hypothetical protein